jgi:phosphoglycolate phosphatase
VSWFVQALNSVAERFHFRPVDDDDLQKLRGCTNREILRHLQIPLWKVPRIALHLRSLAVRDSASIQLFPGIPELLQHVRSRGWTVAVVTSNSEAAARAILGSSASFVDIYECGAGMFGKARKFKRALKRCNATEALCVGDETRDVEAALQAGLTPVVVLWGYASESAFAPYPGVRKYATVQALRDSF